MSGLRTSVWTRRLSGRAPKTGSKPFFARWARASGFEVDRDLPLAQLRLELHHELVDDRLHHLGGQRLEGDDPVEPVAELRVEEALERLLPAGLRVLLAVAGEADRGLAHLARARRSRS